MRREDALTHVIVKTTYILFFFDQYSQYYVDLEVNKNTSACSSQPTLSCFPIM